ncbi:MAG: hypothetical protein Q8P33_02475 [bacterium]|nr:hypothetical protein [bacterium]
MASKVVVAGELYFEIDGKLHEIKRQIRQKGGYPYDPQALNNALHKIVMGDFLGAGPSEVLTPVFTPGDLITPPRPYPALGEVFELTLQPISGLELVRLFGIDPTHWQFRGKEITKALTRKFKLVEISYQPNFVAVLKALKAYGRPAKGLWLKAYKEAYPVPDGNGPVGFADPSWRTPSGYARFPCVSTDGHSAFDWDGFGYGFDGGWRWAVEVD